MRFCDEWLLLPQRLALHEPSATAVVADLHLGYSAARQRLGDAIPLRSIDDEMQSLASAAHRHDIQQLIVAGDLFERGFDEVLQHSFCEVLEKLRIRLLALVPGNHDRGIEEQASALPICRDGVDLGGWHICHGDRPVAKTHTIMGHWHPALRVNGRKHPCFLARGTQLILPAFSLDAAGVDVSVESRWRDWQRYWIRGDEVVAGQIKRTI